MAESPANRSRIVPIIMADHNDAPSATTATTTTPKLAPKPKSTTRKSTAVPKPTVSSARTTRSQTKSFGLDEINANLKTLEERGLYAFDTKGDGNCLYYALSDQMYGNWDHASEIRDNLAAHMKSNRDYFGGFAVASGGERRSKRAAPRRSRTPIATPSPTLTEFDDAFQELISRTATEYVWGGAEEIQAFCQYYKRDIRVYSEDHVQDFRASDAPEHEVREVLHLAYIKAVHYSSVRNIDGPHEGLPNVNPKAPSVVLDLETAQPWKIMCIQEGLGGQYDRDAIVEMLRRCRGDIDRAFAKLLDEESSSTSSCVSSTTSAASSQASTATTASEPEQQKHTGQPHGHNTAPPMANFKPRLMFSRSSSRHSTASKRSADDSDDEGGPISAVRQRGREQKRRILPKVTVGINIGDQEKPDLVSLRLRVNSDVVAERLSPTPSPSEPTEQPKPKLKQEERRKLRPRKPRSSVTSDADTASTISSESRVVKTKE